MRVVVTDTYEQVGVEAARLVAEQIRMKPDSVIGLATGSTMVPLYQRLVALYKTAGLDFSKVSTFNLDEYIGVRPDQPQSYHHYMQEHLFQHVNISPENTYLPDGTAKDVEAECERYERLMESKGGIYLQLLGIGRNAHIGFNEPDIKFPTKTHKVELAGETRLANARFFVRADDVPRYAISMGIKTIMMAQRIVLLASGTDKTMAVYQAVCGDITPKVPASILQLHRDVVVRADREAAGMLPKETYEE